MTFDKKHYIGTCFSGKELLKKHDLSEIGEWEVFGEDPNCDFGGPHHEPFLGVFRGSLEDVIDIAVNLPGFWQWGSGGDIKPHRARRIVDAKDFKKNQTEAQKIRTEIAKLQARLEELE